MSSSVFFKFRSSKEPKTINFDGTGITVFELKREIINQSGLGDGTDFDLQIYDESNPKEEYVDDTIIIPRSSSIIATRRPAARPGHGKAARYVTGKAPVAAKNFARMEKSKVEDAKKVTPAPSFDMNNNALTEEERMKAMFAAEGASWEQQRAQMAHAKPVYFNKNAAVRKHPNSDKPIPLGYICHRCQEKGHWIQDCPTNDDPNYEPKPRLKRTTGIPKSFIKRIDAPNDATKESLAEDLQSGKVMLDAQGNYVIVEPDKAAWEKFEAKHKAATAAQQEAAAADMGSTELQEKGLLCPIDKRLFVDPMKTPCCGKTYCNDCIENTLLDTDLVCPNCGNSVLIDNLIPDDAMVNKIRDHEREMLDREKTAKASIHNEKAVSTDNPGSPLNTAVATKGKTDGDASPKGMPQSPSVTKIKSPSPVASTTSAAPMSNVDSVSKKRPAPEEPERPQIPKGPAAMRNQQLPEQPAASQQNDVMEQMPFMNGMQGMGGTNGMNGMNAQFSQMQMPFAMGHMPNFGMPFFNGMPGMSGMNGMNGMLPMGNGMGMGMNGMNGMPGMNGMNWQQMGAMGNMDGMGNMGGNYNNGMKPNGYRQFNQQAATHQDSAYQRQPVNPNRNQHRTKRARPSDYKTLS